jgi:hypothetical protein
MAPVPLTCGDAELVRAALSIRRPWSFKAALLSEVGGVRTGVDDG